jgi:glycosyltransferase involved in cell wall biosynthesis
MNPSQPLVSLVVPAFNAQRYIDETVQSILAQTYPNIEIILLDDGSTDQTWARLQRYAGRCHVESHPNMGQAGTLNKGWALARGEILGYLSADDTLVPKAIQIAVAQLLAAPDSILVYPDYELIDEASQRISVVRAPDYSYEEIVLRGECPIGPGAFFRRMLFEKAGGWDTRLRQIPDYEFWLRGGLFGSMQRIDQVLASFRVHDTSQTFAVADEAKAAEYLYAMNKYFSRTDVPANILSHRREAYSNAYILTARLHLRSGRYGQGWGALKQAMKQSRGTLLRRRSIKLVANGLVGRWKYYATRGLMKKLKARP